MNDDPRYVPVNRALPEILPALTAAEALRAARKLIRHFGRQRDASAAAVTWDDMKLPNSARRCWITRKPTRGHFRGWGRLIHDVSHNVFGYRHPGFRPHDGGHAALEREIAEYVASKGWLTGALRPAMPAKLDLQEKRAARLAAVDERIVRWQSKLRRAQNAIAKLSRLRRDLMKKLAS